MATKTKERLGQCLLAKRHHGIQLIGYLEDLESHAGIAALKSLLKKRYPHDLLFGVHSVRHINNKSH